MNCGDCTLYAVRYASRLNDCPANIMPKSDDGYMTDDQARTTQQQQQQHRQTANGSLRVGLVLCAVNVAVASILFFVFFFFTFCLFRVHVWTLLYGSSDIMGASFYVMGSMKRRIQIQIHICAVCLFRHRRHRRVDSSSSSSSSQFSFDSTFVYYLFFLCYGLVC